MNNENKEKLKKTLHDFLCKPKQYEETYKWDYLVTVSATFCLEDQKRGFLNFMEHIDCLPDLARLNGFNYNYGDGINLIHYAIIQCASIILGNGNWFSSLSNSASGRPVDAYVKFSDIIFGGDEYIDHDKYHQFPIRGNGMDVKLSVEKDDLAKLKLIIDLDRNPESRLRHIYCYLLRFKKLSIAEKLHSMYGRMGELVPSKALLEYWKNTLIDTPQMTKERFLKEWNSPKKHPLHRIVLNGPHAGQAIKILHKYNLLSKHDLKELLDSGLSPDFILDADYPSLTYRRLMHFIDEFSEDIDTSIRWRRADYMELDRFISEARHFIEWENERQKCKNNTACHSNDNNA